ncbi:right-handed parallel beta-helix repeat-containing protein, partial [PVC group bacterium]|nr:right-handed parallel beta-helix repeat-containing protein [PVC group bacterium]
MKRRNQMLCRILRATALAIAILTICPVWCQSAKSALAEAGAALYVSPSGNDAWSGKLPAPNNARTDGPFRTLTRARDDLRALRKRGALDRGATVWVRGGAYYLSQTFALTAADSGTAAGPIVYRAYADEEAILVGGAQVTGFVPHTGSIVKADLKAIGLGGLEFKQLFCDGKRQILARFPNFDPENPYAGGFLYVAGQPQKPSKVSFQASPEGLREWARPSDGQVWIFPGRNYWNNIVPIKSVDRGTRVITLAKPASYGINPGDRYFIRGLAEELDAPGEWYLDRATSTLYFWPAMDLVNARVSVPRVKTIVSIAKAPNESQWPQHITLRGFTIEGCDGAAVALRNARGCAVVGCTIRNAGSGLSMATCKECLAYGNDIYQTGSSGVAAYSGNRSLANPDANRIENNYIHHTGYFSKTSSAISIRGVANVVAHNLIYDCPRIAIAYNGNDHVIEYNHLRHMNLETQDSGATYCLGRDWTNRGHIVRYNYVHDTLGYGRHGGDRWHSPFFTFGIYLDDWSSGQQVYGNIVARSYLAGIDVHSGRDNVIENNIIYDCYREQMRYQSWPTSHRMLPDMLKRVLRWPFSERYPGLARHRDAVADSTQSYNVFRRNIISYGRPGSRLYAVSGLDHATTEHDYNLIWRRGERPDSSLEKMREKGLDLHSVVADPKFADPDNGDFTLAPDSPALALGFKPIPLDKIGPHEDPRRASWPIV